MQFRRSCVSRPRAFRVYARSGEEVGGTSNDPRRLTWPGVHGRRFGTIRAPANCGPFHAMPNIKQQKKRVRTAAQERLENLRYRSTAKTLAKRLEAAVASGDRDRVAAEHRELVRWLDRAAAKGALHRNTAARRKAQAARLIAERR